MSRGRPVKQFKGVRYQKLSLISKDPMEEDTPPTPSNLSPSSSSHDDPQCSPSSCPTPSPASSPIIPVQSGVATAALRMPPLPVASPPTSSSTSTLRRTSSYPSLPSPSPPSSTSTTPQLHPFTSLSTRGSSRPPLPPVKAPPLRLSFKHEGVITHFATPMSSLRRAVGGNGEEDEEDEEDISLDLPLVSESEEYSSPLIDCDTSP